MRPELVSYENGIAAYRLDGRLVRLRGLSRESAEQVYELRKRSGKIFLTLCYDAGETPALPARRVSDHGGRIVSRGVD
jgi:hypothetical protein